ncbi:DUF3027 domain-containing protein [Mycetocola reblochoni]|uniref:DUF3027 domain-containing protein n=2 Tax=Mycetocola reblochoni TaxID=331618 RepID=A0A1R4IQL3_9MICO|nr:DUF3027 domain-containing protein [Mycetocola reblochoni]SJN22028.1 hypothetical protein FM119_03010 [Mycetocola reblochoni REB411]
MPDAGELNVEPATTDDVVEAATPAEAGGAKDAPVENGPRLADGVLTAAEPLARDALAEVTARSDVGSLTGIEALDPITGLLRFACTRPGYPDWSWTVAVARVDDSSPTTVLEVELLPGDGSLLAPQWLPWSERLAEYKAQQKAEAEARAAAGLADGDTDDDADDADADDADDVDALDEDDLDDALELADDDGVDAVDADDRDVVSQPDDSVDGRGDTGGARSRRSAGRPRSERAAEGRRSADSDEHAATADSDDQFSSDDIVPAGDDGDDSANQGRSKPRRRRFWQRRGRG